MIVRKNCYKMEDAGIITNMNVTGDTKAMHPSGLRLGVQELTRVGMKPNDMKTVTGVLSKSVAR